MLAGNIHSVFGLIQAISRLVVMTDLFSVIATCKNIFKRLNIF